MTEPCLICGATLQILARLGICRACHRAKSIASAEFQAERVEIDAHLQYILSEERFEKVLQERAS